MSSNSTPGPARPGSIRDGFVQAGLLALPVVLGGLSGLTTIDAIQGWYRQLARPDWTPPDAAFGPVWTTLYLSMGVALVLVWRAGPGRRDVRVALLLFAIQLVLNLGWSAIFFLGRAIGPALIEIIALWLAIAATVVAFWRVRPAAGLILVPYLGWVTVATALNASIWQLNR